MEPARNLVSQVRSTLKLTSTDPIISDRMILEELLRINVKLMVQQLNKRQEVNNPDIYTPLDCLELEQVPLYECCNTQSDCMVTRTKEELPSIVATNYGSAVQYVSALNKKIQFNQIQHPQTLANLLSIYPKKKLDTYFWIQKNRLYTTSPDLETISAAIFFKDLVDPQDYTCSEEKNDCPTNPLDLPWKGSLKLQADILNITATNLANTYLRLPEQRSSDNMEGN